MDIFVPGFLLDTHSLDTRRIRLEPRSHRLALRPPYAPTISDQMNFGSAKTINGTSFLPEAKGLYTATLDRVTFRDSTKKYGKQISNKYQSNTIENRRYHTFGKPSYGPRSRETHDTSNGSVSATSHSLLVDPLNKRTNGIQSGIIIESFLHQTNGANEKSQENSKKLMKPKSTDRLFDDIRREEFCDFRYK